jgi:hypothetical protein
MTNILDNSALDQLPLVLGRENGNHVRIDGDEITFKASNTRPYNIVDEFDKLHSRIDQLTDGLEIAEQRLANLEK